MIRCSLELSICSIEYFETYLYENIFTINTMKEGRVEKDTNIIILSVHTLE